MSHGLMCHVSCLVHGVSRVVYHSIGYFWIISALACHPVLQPGDRVGVVWWGLTERSLDTAEESTLGSRLDSSSSEKNKNMLAPLPPTPRAATRHAASHVRTNSEGEKAPPLGIVNYGTSTRRASTMLIFGDPADEATGFGVGGEASDDDGQQQLPAGAEEGGLAGQMRSAIKQRAMRLGDLKLARQNACYDEHGHAAEEISHGPADEVYCCCNIIVAASVIEMLVMQCDPCF